MRIRTRVIVCARLLPSLHPEGITYEWVIPPKNGFPVCKSFNNKDSMFTEVAEATDVSEVAEVSEVLDSNAEPLP